MKFLSLTNRNWKEIFRDPLSIVLGLAMPVFMLFLFASLNKRMPLENFAPQNLTPGIVIFGFTFIIMFASILISKDKQTSFLIRLFTTPLKPSDYILSYMLPFIPLAFLQICVCFIIGILLGATFVHFLLCTVFLCLIAITCINIGIILGSLFSVNQVSGLGSLLITGIGLFSGIWMDINMVGGVIEKIGYALPFAHGVDVTKGILAGKSLSLYLNSIYVILFYTIVTFLLAVFSFKKMIKREK